MEVLSDIPSVTYAYYFDHIKLTPQEAENSEKTADSAEASKGGKTVWRCIICGYEYVGDELPEDFICPLCKHPASDFEKIVK